uniref:Uncharacterized protein n=1 Tax=Ananas comosus var. bracteatus TaxID=296719 RepID=A0A6V7NPW6_ANACO|nr:unnamed protein product [Ananas comosus var. bracteatus]
MLSVVNGLRCHPFVFNDGASKSTISIVIYDLYHLKYDNALYNPKLTRDCEHTHPACRSNTSYHHAGSSVESVSNQDKPTTRQKHKARLPELHSWALPNRVCKRISAELNQALTGYNPSRKV